MRQYLHERDDRLSERDDGSVVDDGQVEAAAALRAGVDDVLVIRIRFRISILGVQNLFDGLTCLVDRPWPQHRELTWFL